MIEKSRIIFKNIIRMGPELDFEKFKAKLLERRFKPNERIVPTPEGPLKEYVMTEPKYLRDLIIISRKGFVVDSRDINYALELIALAYDLYENIMRDYVEYIQVDIMGLYELIVLLRNAENLARRIFRKDIVADVNRELGNDLKPFGLSFCKGVPAAPHEFVVINLVPVLIPYRESSRLKVNVSYRGTDSEKAVRFLRDMPSIIEKLVKVLSSPQTGG